LFFNDSVEFAIQIYHIEFLVNARGSIRLIVKTIYGDAFLPKKVWFSVEIGANGPTFLIKFGSPTLCN